MVFEKGNVPWNKGLTKKIDSRVDYFRPTIFKKGDKINLGKKQSDIHRINLSESHKRMHNSIKTEFKKGDPILKKRINSLRANGKIMGKKKDTPIETKIRIFLDNLQIEYFQHKYININHCYQCDFFIPSTNLVIECDGDYWHSYPTGREIDHIRTKELLERGFKVLRLWEFEIKNMTLESFKERIR